MIWIFRLGDSCVCESYGQELRLFDNLFIFINTFKLPLNVFFCLLLRVLLIDSWFR